MANKKEPLKIITRSVLSYCNIPESIRKNYFQEQYPDSFVEYSITSKEEQAKFDDDFSLDDWIIKNYPELEGQTILIHIDY